MDYYILLSFQSSCCFAYLKNDTYDNFVENRDGSIRMDIGLEYDNNGCHRVQYDDFTPNTFHGFVACLEKRARDAQELLKTSAINLQVEEDNTNGLMMMNTETAKSVSCRDLLRDYLSTFDFLKENRYNFTIYLSLPPEYDEMQKSQFIKILKTVTTAGIVYANPFYALFIETCNPQKGFARNTLGDISSLILDLGYYESVLSVVNYRNELSIKSSVVSSTLSIKNLCRMVSESLINEQFGEMAPRWTEAERAMMVFKLMKPVLRSPADITEGDTIDINFGDLPGGERKDIFLTIDHFNQCAAFINELNALIDTALNKAGMTVHSIAHFGVYSELSVHSVVANTIAGKVGEEKLFILENPREDYLIVGMLWLKALFQDSFVSGDSLLRDSAPGKDDRGSPLELSPGKDDRGSPLELSPELDQSFLGFSGSIHGMELDHMDTTLSPGLGESVTLQSVDDKSPRGKPGFESIDPPSSDSESGVNITLTVSSSSDVVISTSSGSKTNDSEIISKNPDVQEVPSNYDMESTKPSGDYPDPTLHKLEPSASRIDTPSAPSFNLTPGIVIPTPHKMGSTHSTEPTILSSPSLRLSEIPDFKVPNVPNPREQKGPSADPSTSFSSSLSYTPGKSRSPSPGPISPPIGPISPNLFQNPQKLREFLQTVHVPDVVRQFYEKKLNHLCDADYFVANQKILQKGQLPFATYEYVIKENVQMLISLPVYKGTPDSLPLGYAETIAQEISQGTKYYFLFDVENNTVFFSVKDSQRREVCSRRKLFSRKWDV